MRVRGTYHGSLRFGGRVDLRGVWLATGRRVACNRGERIELDGYSFLDLGLTGRIHMRTLIDEEKVSDTWVGY